MCPNAIKVCLIQCGSESNSGTIYRLNPVRFIVTFRLGFFVENWEKREDILDWEWGLISDPGDREKRPCLHLSKCHIVGNHMSLLIVFANAFPVGVTCF